MNRVIVYVKEYCQPCRMTKISLTRKGIPFTEVMLDERPDKIDYMKSKGFRSAPFIEVYKSGDKVDEWSGFKPDKVRGLDGVEA